MEGFDHAGDGSQQAQKRRDGDDRVQNAQAAVQHGRFAQGQLFHRPLNGIGVQVAVADAVRQKGGDRAGMLVADPQRVIDPARRQMLAHLLGQHFVIGGGPRDRDKALNHHGDGKDGAQQQRPHDRAAVVHESADCI